MERIFLATTSIKEFWDDSSKIALLGPWCAPYGNEASLEQLKNGYVRLPLLWKNTEDIESAVKYCFDVFIDMLDEISSLLNEIHGLDKPRRYYHCIIGNWLYHFIHETYDKFLSLKAAASLHPSISTFTLDRKHFVVPTDGDALLKLTCYNDEYNLQLYSQILEFLPIKTELKSLKKPLEQSCSYRTDGNTDNGSRTRSEKLFELFNSMFRTRAVMLSGTHFKHRSDYIRLALASRFLFISDNMNYRTITEFKIDHSLRDEVRLKNDKDEFRNILSRILFQNIPALYLEGFSTFRNNALSLPINRADAYYSTTSMYSHNIFKFVVAEKIEKSIIATHQHGGNYKTNKQPEEEHVERMCSDIMFTWGWKDNDKTRPLPHPMLNKPPNADSIARGENPLLILTSHPGHVFRIQIPVISSRYGEYFEEVTRFLSLCDHDILVRTSPNDFNQRVKDRVREAIPHTRFDDFSKPCDYRMLEAPVVIQAHLATTYLECVAMDIPLILFLNPARYSFLPDSRLFFEQMKKVGILHDTPESAAGHLKDIFANISEWWQSEPVTTFLKDFKHHHARTDPQWAKLWTEEFNKLFKNRTKATSGY